MSDAPAIVTRPRSFLRRWVFSTDHKVIGLQYFFLALFAVLAGTALSVLMRLHLAWPASGLGEMKPETYLSYVTIHGTLMVFFVLSTAPQSAFGNYFLPLQIGASEMAFPVLNMLSFWTTALSLLILLASFFVPGGAPLSGWTAYPPLSALAAAGPGQATGMDLWLVSIALFCVASLMGAINLIVTVLDMRTRGMTWMRMPLTCWAWLVTAGITLLAFGVLLAAGLLLIADRNFGTSFFLPAGISINEELVRGGGGSPLLWQHLFWYFGHPEVYLAILPAMGITTSLLSTFSRKPVFGYRGFVVATFAIGVLGFLVWGHHMFISGMNPFAGFAFSMLTMAVAVPSAVKTFNWLGTIWGGRLRFPTPMLFAIGFVSFFVTGGISGPFLAQPQIDIYLHDTYFVLAHFHLIMGVAALFGIFAATYFWFPKMFGRMMSEHLGRLHFWLTLLGAYAVFMPMHFLGLAGHPRRYSHLTESAAYLQPLIPLQQFITVAALVTAAAQLIFLFNLFWSMRRGAPAEANPWQATTLEWTLPSPAPARGFGDQAPRVHHGAYEYGVPGSPSDFIMQTDPPSGTAAETGIK